MIRGFTLAGALVALLALATTAQAATIWTPIDSGTTSTITSIVYQSPTRFWYATSSGTIATFNGSAFVAGTGITPGENFTDLAFQPGGSVGYAITSNGHVWRSTNAGASWKLLATPATRGDCSDTSTAGAETELNAVQWANSTTVYLLGNTSTILRSINADGGSPTFSEINKLKTGTCAVQNEPFTENFTDATFLPANPADAFFVAQDFGRIYQSSNALSASVSGTKTNGDTVNSFTGDPRIAQDANNPNRLWVVDHESGGGGCGTLCLQVSTDGGNNTSAASFPNDSSVTGGLYDISSQGGVEVTAGSGGEIFTSVDGTNFYKQPADGALATENWRAEAAYDAAHAAVGGENGALAVTAAANKIPDIIAPTGSISGPTTVTSGKATTYTAVHGRQRRGSGRQPRLDHVDRAWLPRPARRGRDIHVPARRRRGYADADVRRQRRQHGHGEAQSHGQRCRARRQRPAAGTPDGLEPDDDEHGRGHDQDLQDRHRHRAQRSVCAGRHLGDEAAQVHG